MAPTLLPRFWIVLVLMFFLVACGDEAGDDGARLTVDPDRQTEAVTPSGNKEVDQLLAKSLFLLPVTATAEQQVRALASYIGGAFAHEKPSSLNLETLVAEKRITPYAAITLAYHMAGVLAWERRVLVLDCAPGTVWYLEVNTEDGRFLLDPYRRSVAPLAGPLDIKLSYTDAFVQVEWLKAAGRWPPATYEAFQASWQLSDDGPLHLARYDGACLRAFYDKKKAVVFPIPLDMTGRSKRRVGITDDSPWDIEALYADGHEETRSDHAFWGGFETPVGPVTVAHQLRLRGLIPGSKYHYVFREVGESKGYVVALPLGITVGSWISDGDGRWTLPFTAVDETATLEVGLGGGGSLALDWFAVSEASEVLP